MTIQTNFPNLKPTLLLDFANIDTIGVIYKRTGGTDEEPVMGAIPGWHVNVRLMPGEGCAPLESYKITPSSPLRVWG